MNRDSIEKLVDLYDSGHDIYQIAAVFKIHHNRVVTILKANNRSGIVHQLPASVSRKKSNMRKVIETHQKLVQDSSDDLPGY